MVIYRLLLFLMCFPVGATVFQIQPIDQQIKEADGIIVGHFLESKAIKLENDSIATQMVFKINKEIGIQSELYGMNEVIVHYPGGQIGDEGVYVSGVPKFVPGEKLVILIKSNKDRFWGMNLGFGSFKVINYGNEKLIVNSIFPNDLRVSQIAMDDFEKKVRIIKGARLKVVLDDQSYPTEEAQNKDVRLPASLQEEGKNRAIASKTEESENSQGEQQSMNSAWLLMILAALGAAFRLAKKRAS